ncbi:MAG: ribosome small subunit-dependent GTPase A [Verrucomicrobia bacterium]|nr:ribosome small subunit-dependent GTPase A [Verrucomicrobiota bacterium]
MIHDGLDEEEDFHSKDRKQFRKERRHAQETDRSKFKKTDQKQAKAPIDTSLPRGRVVAISGEGAWVEGADGTRRLCTLKGLLKKEKMHAKNIIAVGDFVRFQDDSIIQVEERYSYLSRQDVTGRKEQLIAVNIDQVLITTSVVDPALKPALIDRYIIAARKGNMHPVLLVNKIDLLQEASEEEREFFRAFLSAYEPLGFPILSISTRTETGIEALRSLMKNKSSVFSGQSGVGKSSLINAAFGLSLKIGDLAQKTFKGSHTTTVAELLTLPGGGYCIDTPGVRSFGIWGLEKEDVTQHFTEILEFACDCKFPDCTHLEEPHCAVQAALEEGKISPIRYESYRSLLAEAIGDIDNWTRDKL